MLLVVVGLMMIVGTAEAQGANGQLVGNRYVSTSVVKNGEPHDLVEGTRIRVRFDRRNGHHVVSWRAGCNRFGARVRIRPRRLITGQIASTRVACSDALHRQDRWVASVFRRNPRWALRGRRLRLRSGDDVIRLRRHTKGQLAGNRYESISVIRNGKPHELVEGTRIHVRFERRNGHHVVSWRAGCNRFGARVRIRPRRLLAGQIVGTEVACRAALHRQDAWVARVFRRDPRWMVRGAKLTLKAGDDAIRLRRQR